MKFVGPRITGLGPGLLLRRGNLRFDVFRGLLGWGVLEGFGNG